MQEQIIQQPPQVYIKLRRWVEGLSCLGSALKFIAVSTPSSSSSSSSSSSVILCSNILHLCNEIVPVAFASSAPSASSPDDADRRIEEYARVSVFQRTLAILSSWIDPASCAAHSPSQQQLSLSSSARCLPSGLHSRVHWAMTMCFALHEQKQQRRQGVPSSSSSSSFLSQVSSDDLRRSLRDVTEKCIAMSRTRIEKHYEMREQQQTRKCRDDERICVHLARYAFHYHDGELLDLLQHTMSSRSSSSIASSAFFISINNHASFLACRAFEEIILQSSSSSSSSPSVSGFFNKERRRLSSASSGASNFLGRHVHLISVPFSLDPAVAFDDRSDNNAASRGSAILNGLGLWLMPTQHFLLAKHSSSSSSAAASSAALWEEAALSDYCREGFVLTRDFASELGMLPSAFRDVMAKTGGRVAGKIRLLLAADLQFEDDEQHDDRGHEDLLQASATESDDVFFAILLPASSASSCGDEALALLSEKCNIIVARVPSVWFTRLALATNTIPQIIKVSSASLLASSSSSSRYAASFKRRLIAKYTDLDQILVCNARLSWAAEPADYFSTRSSSALGVFLQLLSCHKQQQQQQTLAAASSSPLQLQQHSGRNMALSRVLRDCVTVLLFRRSVAQLISLRDVFGRVVQHLWSCCCSVADHSDVKNTTRRGQRDHHRRRVLLVRGGGLVDCVWISCLRRMIDAAQQPQQQQQQQQQSEHTPQRALIDAEMCKMLQTALRAYLAVLHSGSCLSPAFSDERVEAFIADLDRDENDDDDDDIGATAAAARKHDKRIRFGPLFMPEQLWWNNGYSIDENGDDAEKEEGPVDALEAREEALLAAVEFVGLAALGSASVERGWKVDERGEPQRTLNLRGF